MPTHYLTCIFIRSGVYQKLLYLNQKYGTFLNFSGERICGKQQLITTLNDWVEKVLQLNTNLTNYKL